MQLEYLSILQWSTFAATVLMILSGIPPSYEVYRTKDASKSPLLFFTLAIANGIGWLHYGYLIANFNLVSLNSLALVLNTSYVLLYLAYSPDWTDFSYKFTTLLAYFSALYYHLYRISQPASFLNHLGASCSLVNIVFMLLPLLDIGRMLKSRDTGKTHLSILVAGVLCTALWAMYGWAIGDYNVMIPNVLGVACSVSCLLVRISLQAGTAASPSEQRRLAAKAARSVKKDN